MGTSGVIYAVLVVVLTWPLALYLQTAIVGGGDTYHHLWGFWWFDRALERGSSFWTCPLVFHPYSANLVVDDWPLGPNLLASWTRRLGLTLIGSYNASLLLAIWLNAMSVFVLVRAVVREWWPALIAGVFFAFSPYFWGRLQGHVALMHAYPLALLALCVYKSQQTRSAGWALGVGGALGLAIWSQSYYAIYAGAYLGLACLYDVCPISLRVERRDTSRPQVPRILVVVGSLAAIIAVAVALPTGLDGRSSHVQDSVRRFARPMMIWWMSWLLAFVLCYRVVLIRREKTLTPLWDDPVRFWGCVALPVILLASPVLAGNTVGTLSKWARASRHCLKRLGRSLSAYPLPGRSTYASDYWRFTPEGMRVLFPAVKFDAMRSCMSTSLPGEFKPFDDSMFRAELSVSTALRQGQYGFLRSLLVRSMRRLRLLPFIFDYQYLHPPVMINMIGQKCGQ